MLKRFTAALVAAALLLICALPVFAEESTSSLPSAWDSYSQMTTSDWLLLFGGFFGAMFLSMLIYGLYLKNKRKKKRLDKYGKK